MEELNQIMASTGITSNFHIVTTTKSGIISYVMDDYTNYTSQEVMPECFDKKDTVSLYSIDLIAANSPVYKIITDDTWNIVVKLDDVFDGFVEGAKKALAPALVAVLVYTILVVATYHPFQLTVYKAILGLTKGFNIVTTTLVAIISSILNVDAAYSFQSVVPYYASVVTKASNYPLVAIIFQTMYGLTMLVAPTSLILMATLSYLKVSYKDWLKNVWKLLLELFVILLIIFIVLALL